MTVNELIERLGDYDGDAEVRIMTQQAWPFENSLYGIISREETHEQEEGDGEAYEDQDAEATDVFLVEGTQLCYGMKAAWNCDH